MTTTVASIVEGDGEVAALPVLLLRLSLWKTPEAVTKMLPPIRVRKDKFLNQDTEFNRHVLLAAAKCGSTGWILILLDSDDDCPADVGAQILKRANTVAPHRRIAVVLANREYEAWFMAGHAAQDAELKRDAKGWVGHYLLDGTYRERTDQPKISATVDLPTVFANSRSFRKLCSEWLKNTNFSPPEFQK
jgi:hypothetical protein